jgi:bisphosphoglycerate-independent phosphoglycerate mutase (AlkP superfamily)
LWIREPARRHSHHAEKVPLAAVAPTLLDLLGIEKPASMKERSVFQVSERVAQPV